MGCGEWGTVGAVFRSGAPGHRRGVLAITATRVGGTIWYGNVWNIWYGIVRYGTVWYGRESWQSQSEFLSHRHSPRWQVSPGISDHGAITRFLLFVLIYLLLSEIISFCICFFQLSSSVVCPGNFVALVCLCSTLHYITLNCTTLFYTTLQHHLHQAPACRHIDTSPFTTRERQMKVVSRYCYGHRNSSLIYP